MSALRFSHVCLSFPHGRFEEIPFYFILFPSPGPRWLPLLGNLLDLKRLVRKLGSQHAAFEALCAEYGSAVLGLRLGSDLVVVASGYEAVTEVLTSDVFLGRPDNFFMRLRTMGTRKGNGHPRRSCLVTQRSASFLVPTVFLLPGITTTDGPLWSEQRRFAVRHFRQLGYGKVHMEELILAELKDLLNELEPAAEQVRSACACLHSLVVVLLCASAANMPWCCCTVAGVGRVAGPAAAALRAQRAVGADGRHPLPARRPPAAAAARPHEPARQGVRHGGRRPGHLALAAAPRPGAHRLQPPHQAQRLPQGAARGTYCTVPSAQRPALFHCPYSGPSGVQRHAESVVWWPRSSMLQAAAAGRPSRQLACVVHPRCIPRWKCKCSSPRSRRPQLHL